LQKAKDELENSQKELHAMMKRLEEAKEMEMAEKQKLEDEIRTKQLEVQRIADEVQRKDEETRRLQASLLFDFSKRNFIHCSFEQNGHDVHCFKLFKRKCQNLIQISLLKCEALVCSFLVSSWNVIHHVCWMVFLVRNVNLVVCICRRRLKRPGNGRKKPQPL